MAVCSTCHSETGGERAECEDLGEAAKSPLSVTSGLPALEGPGPP